MAEFTEKQILEVLEAARQLERVLDRSMRADDTKDLEAGGTTDDLEFETVKPGRELVINHLSGYDNTSSPTRVRVGYFNGHSFNWLETQPAPLVSETVAVRGEIRLREGMYAIVRFEGATQYDDLYASLNGYWIKA